MDDRPRDRAEDRGGRGGPLSDEGSADETWRVPLGGETGGSGGGGYENEPTRQLTPEEAASERQGAPQRVSRRMRNREDSETRVIRTEGSPRARMRGGGEDDDAVPYPRGYLEAADQRESRLREVYGGIDWLASFIGCVIAIVSVGVLGLILGLVLTPLGLSLDLGGAQLQTAAIIGLVLVGLALFFAYLFGGYVAGRLARFDGGRNGAMTVLWGILLTAILALVPLVGGAAFGPLQDTVQNAVIPAVGDLRGLGLIGLGIVAGALLLELLGGFIGGRMGSRYHTRIDRTT